MKNYFVFNAKNVYKINNIYFVIFVIKIIIYNVSIITEITSFKKMAGLNCVEAEASFPFQSVSSVKIVRVYMLVKRTDALILAYRNINVI